MTPRTRSLPAVIASVLLAASWLLAAPAQAADVITPGTPTISGAAQFEQTLTAAPGTWSPPDVTFSYQWFRGGVPVGGDATYRLSSLDDVGASFTVRVTGSRAGSDPVTATSAPTAPVAPATFTATSRPRISGSGVYGRKLTGRVGSWSRKVDDVDYRWLRDGRPITGATGRHYRVRSADAGSKIRFEVRARRAGFTSVVATSKAVTGRHVHGVRKAVTYTVTTRGSVGASLATFKRQAQETYDDPRGWRANGIRFKRVSSNGDFTLVLSQASKVPSFSSACSTTYSCRVGRFVVINETRWKNATPTWNGKNGSLRDYRHMVVNHETGHWLERGHVGCGGKGQLAPVMQQQSKGLGGCKINPWPKKGELYSPRFGF
ncbi:MAG: hypothetical protein JWR55_1734 [Aeromicrobium sp.]|nr:hypothetical protein [Aeromicrobium sp.]